jgi:hypothetical protein
MDSPSLDSAQPTVLAHREPESGDISGLIEPTERVTRAGTMVIVGFGEAVAADYAMFVSQSCPDLSVIVVDANIQRLVQSPIRSLSADEFLRLTPENGSELWRAASLVLFINPRLTARERRELDDVLEIARRSQVRFVAIISTLALSAPFASIWMILVSKRSRTMSCHARRTCRHESSSFVPDMCLAGTLS